MRRPGGLQLPYTSRVPVVSIGELFIALGAGRYDDLVGTRESGWFEAKSAPYILDRVRQRWELAKDVASLANETGGAIVIGAATRKPLNEIGETVLSVDGVRRDLVNPGQVQDIIHGWTYPPVETRVHWFPESEREGRANLFVIEVLPTAQHERYAVVRKLVEEDGQAWEAMAIPIRRGDQVRWLSAEEIQHLVGDGLRARQSAPAPPLEAEQPDGDSRVATLEDAMAWGEEPVLYLQALPFHGSLVEALFDRVDGIQGLLERHHLFQLRQHGFTIGTAGPRAHEGSLLAAGEPRRATLIDQDGVVTVGALATERFLGWASPNFVGPGQRSVINPVPLTEFVLEFVRFVEELVMTRARAERCQLRALARRLFTAGPVGLAPRPLDMALFPGQSPNASGDVLQTSTLASGDVAHDAYQLLAGIYGWFGLPPTAIQFAEAEAISADALRKLK